jgi:hypothetical protein
MEEAIEDVAGWADDNSDVSVPHNQIAGLRFRTALESIHAVIQIVGLAYVYGKPARS